MVLLSTHEAIVWIEFHKGKTTGDIALEYEKSRKAPEYVFNVFKKIGNPSEQSRIEEKTVFKDLAYISRVLSRAKKKIESILKDHAKSHRLDVESVLDYKGILQGFDYQANAPVYIVYTIKLGTIIWYKHDSYAGKLCPKCPKEEECRETLDTIMQEYNIILRDDEKDLHMTQQSIAIFNKLAAKEVPRYKRKEDN
ncbi:MAG: hypothetical protein ACTSUO_01095 [Candidatus Thorarchaeota archaeon]